MSMTNAQAALLAAATIATQDHTTLRSADMITSFASHLHTWLDKQDEGVIAE